jgi:acyl-CoA thioesterase-2
MSQVLDDLVDLLTLEPIEENLFRGRSQDLGFRQLFGGQVLGQSLSAASQTVERRAMCIRCTATSCVPGDAGLPVVYRWTACATAAVSARAG